MIKSTIFSNIKKNRMLVMQFYYQIVTLSKTKKKGREHKEVIVNSIRDAVENYNSIYVFSYQNMRNLKFIMINIYDLRHFEFFLGSNKVMQISLGRSVSDEIRPGIHKVSKHDFARTGATVNEKVELKEGPLEQFTHEMEPFLRKQGMPVRLNGGVVELVSDFVVCDQLVYWFVLDSSSCLGSKWLHFLMCQWSAEKFEILKEGLDLDLSDIESS
ncbi:hypothetical protein ACHQM5_007649 [Ranunculus cassubicifolius]